MIEVREDVALLGDQGQQRTRPLARRWRVLASGVGVPANMLRSLVPGSGLHRQANLATRSEISRNDSISSTTA